MNTLHIKKGDTVVILAGNEKGKTGKVLKVFPKTNLVVIEGIGMHKKNQKPRTPGQKGQIIDKHHPIQASKVMNTELQKERAKKSKKTTSSKK
jgi:large subunit ribosomal protein L24